MKITIEQIVNASRDIIDDTDWCNDSETWLEHRGVVNGLYRLVKHFKELESNEVTSGSERGGE